MANAAGHFGKSISSVTYLSIPTSLPSTYYHYALAASSDATLLLASASTRNTHPDSFQFLPFWTESASLSVSSHSSPTAPSTSNTTSASNTSILYKANAPIHSITSPTYNPQQNAFSTYLALEAGSITALQFQLDQKHPHTKHTQSVPLSSCFDPSSFFVSWSISHAHAPNTPVTALASVDQSLVSAAKDGSIALWDLSNAKKVCAFQAHRGAAKSVALGLQQEQETSQLSNIVVSGGADKVVKLWDVRTNSYAPLAELKGHTGWVHSVLLSTYNDTPVVCSASGDRTVRVWDIATLKLLYLLEGHEFRTWSVATPCLSRDYLASCSTDGTVRIWDMCTATATASTSATTRIPSVVLTGHRDAVLAVAASPDGKCLISGAENGSILFWNARAAMGQETPQQNQVLEHEEQKQEQRRKHEQDQSLEQFTCGSSRLKGNDSDDDLQIHSFPPLGTQVVVQTTVLDPTPPEPEPEPEPEPIVVDPLLCRPRVAHLNADMFLKGQGAMDQAGQLEDQDSLTFLDAFLNAVEVEKEKGKENVQVVTDTETDLDERLQEIEDLNINIDLDDSIEMGNHLSDGGNNDDNDKNNDHNSYTNSNNSYPDIDIDIDIDVDVGVRGDLDMDLVPDDFLDDLLLDSSLHLTTNNKHLNPSSCDRHHPVKACSTSILDHDDDDCNHDDQDEDQDQDQDRDHHDDSVKLMHDHNKLQPRAMPVQDKDQDRDKNTNTNTYSRAINTGLPPEKVELVSIDGLFPDDAIYTLSEVKDRMRLIEERFRKMAVGVNKILEGVGKYKSQI